MASNQPGRAFIQSNIGASSVSWEREKKIVLFHQKTGIRLLMTIARLFACEVLLNNSSPPTGHACCRHMHQTTSCPPLFNTHRKSSLQNYSLFRCTIFFCLLGFQFSGKPQASIFHQHRLTFQPKA